MYGLWVLPYHYHFWGIWSFAEATEYGIEIGKVREQQWAGSARASLLLEDSCRPSLVVVIGAAGCFALVLLSDFVAPLGDLQLSLCSLKSLRASINFVWFWGLVGRFVCYLVTTCWFSEVSPGSALRNYLSGSGTIEDIGVKPCWPLREANTLLLCYLPGHYCSTVTLWPQIYGTAQPLTDCSPQGLFS